MERYRIGPGASVYFVTFSVVEWLPVFVTEDTCAVIVESLDFCRRQKGLRINAFVVMPTHFHAIVFHESYQSDLLQSALNDFRKFTGRRLLDYCTAHMPKCFSQVFHEQAGEDRQRRFWQPSRHPMAIETEKFWQQKLDYLHENPCRKGLVIRAEHWRYSSAAFWLLDNPPKNDVELTALQW